MMPSASGFLTASSVGRFMTPDWSATIEPVPYAKLDDPQTLNLYAYVTDNPTTATDPTGHASFKDPWDPYVGPPPWWLKGELLADVIVGAVESEPITFDEADLASTEAAEAAAEAQAQHQAAIANTAINTVGSTEYLVSEASGSYPAGADKCNEFTAATIEKSGLTRPQVPYTGIKGWLRGILGLETMRDPSSHEWADPKVNIPGWSSPRPLTEAAPGAVIAQEHGETGGHVGIVVSVAGTLQTVSASTAVTPAGKVTLSNWGFRQAPYNGEGPHDPAPVVRIYVGGPQ